MYTPYPKESYIRVVSVGSQEEAFNSMMTYDGKLNLYFDLPNGKLYTKQLNANGTMDFKTYTLEPPADPPKPVEYVDVETFTNLVGEVAELRKKIGELL